MAQYNRGGFGSQSTLNRQNSQYDSDVLSVPDVAPSQGVVSFPGVPPSNAPIWAGSSRYDDSLANVNGATQTYRGAQRPLKPRSEIRFQQVPQDLQRYGLPQQSYNPQQPSLSQQRVFDQIQKFGPYDPNTGAYQNYRMPSMIVPSNNPGLAQPQNVAQYTNPRFPNQGNGSLPYVEPNVSDQNVVMSQAPLLGKRTQADAQVDQSLDNSRYNTAENQLPQVGFRNNPQVVNQSLGGGRYSTAESQPTPPVGFSNGPQVRNQNLEEGLYGTPESRPTPPVGLRNRIAEWFPAFGNQQYANSTYQRPQTMMSNEFQRRPSGNNVNAMASNQFGRRASMGNQYNRANNQQQQRGMQANVNAREQAMRDYASVGSMMNQGTGYQGLPGTVGQVRNAYQQYAPSNQGFY